MQEHASCEHPREWAHPKLRAGDILTLECDLSGERHTLTAKKGDDKFGPEGKPFTMELPMDEEHVWYPAVCLYNKDSWCEIVDR